MAALVAACGSQLEREGSAAYPGLCGSFPLREGLDQLVEGVRELAKDEHGRLFIEPDKRGREIIDGVVKPGPSKFSVFAVNLCGSETDNTPTWGCTIRTKFDQFELLPF